MRDGFDLFPAVGADHLLRHDRGRAIDLAGVRRQTVGNRVAPGMRDFAGEDVVKLQPHARLEGEPELFEVHSAADLLFAEVDEHQGHVPALEETRHDARLRLVAVDRLDGEGLERQPVLVDAEFKYSC